MTTPHNRTDTRSWAIVDEGIRLLLVEGYASAEKFLQANGIAARIIERVINRPQERRSLQMPKPDNSEDALDV